MSRKTLSARIAELEAYSLPADVPPYILVQVVNAAGNFGSDTERQSAGPDNQQRALRRVTDLCGLAVMLDGHTVLPQPGDTLDSLSLRAVALHWQGSGVPVLMEAWDTSALTYCAAADEPGPARPVM